MLTAKQKAPPEFLPMTLSFVYTFFPPNLTVLTVYSFWINDNDSNRFSVCVSDSNSAIPNAKANAKTNANANAIVIVIVIVIVASPSL